MGSRAFLDPSHEEREFLVVGSGTEPGPLTYEVREFLVVSPGAGTRFPDLREEKGNLQ